MEISKNTARAIVENIRKVAVKKDISFLSKQAYEFITLKMGFIAHYDLYGFQLVYKDLREFFLRLQTSEYSNDKNYNLREADRQENDSDFKKWYGEENQKNTAWVMREIIKIARKFSRGNREDRRKEEVGQEIKDKGEKK